MTGWALKAQGSTPAWWFAGSSPLRPISLRTQSPQCRLAASITVTEPQNLQMWVLVTLNTRRQRHAEEWGLGMGNQGGSTCPGWGTL